MNDPRLPTPPASALASVPDGPLPAPADGPAAAEHALLSPQQRRAIGLLAGGASISAAADAAGIGRSTLHRWLREDPHFRAAHNAWQEELMASARSRVLRLADGAVDAVAAGLEKRDPRCGLTVLTRLGLLAPATPGPTAPEIVRQDIAEEKRVERVRRSTRKAKLDREAFEAEVNMMPGGGGIP